MTDPGVQYREIAGFPGYYVGDDGSVWSVHNKFGRHFTGYRRLKTARHGGGYRVAVLRAAANQKRGGKGSSLYVHRLVLEAFVGACPPDMQCCRHLDGNPGNNRLENLAWGTHKENAQDARDHMTLAIAAGVAKATLTEKDVSICRLLLDEGYATVRVALLLGVTDSTVRAIRGGKSLANLMSEWRAEGVNRG